MVKIEINGNPIEARDGSMVIEAADEAGITIPRFCYHKKLSVAANCRMCLVEVEKAPKPLPACATPVTEGMRIFTRSQKALDAQKGVMEFLLINHPLDCPICDQGGECDLQDMAMGFGKSASRFTEQKRVVADKNLGPLIATDMTRCIHCTRCVRFGKEIAGIMELGATGRGEHMEIGTFVERSVTSELSGNVIDLCPVGALTSKPYRYTGRPWENRQARSISPHDCVGSNLLVESRRERVMRVLPDENESINETWISDRDRFSYTALSSDDRLHTPLIKQGSSWKEVDWQTALNYAVAGLNQVKETSGAEQIGALVSPSSTLEELFLTQKLVRGLGAVSIDHRLRQQDFGGQDDAPPFPWLGQSIADLQSLDAALLIGANVRKDQPLIAHRLRKAALSGSKIMFVNALAYDFNFPVAEQLVTTPAEMVRSLAAVVKALVDITGTDLPDDLSGVLKNIDVHDPHLVIANHLNNADNAGILIGSQALNQHEQADLVSLAGQIAKMTNARVGVLSSGANSAGAWLSGAVPHRGPGGQVVASGKTAGDMLQSGMNAYLTLNVEPEFDCANPGSALRNMNDADFVVCLTPFVTDTMRTYADVILPVAAFTETSGTYVNVEGRWQSFAGCVAPPGDARPAWKVLRVMGNLFSVDGFDYLSSEDICSELSEMTSAVEPAAVTDWRPLTKLPALNGSVTRIGYVPMYAVDGLVRRAQSLQQTEDAGRAAVIISPETARAVGITAEDQVRAKQGEFSATLSVVVDDAVPDHCALLPPGLVGTENLGEGYGEIELAKVD